MMLDGRLVIQFYNSFFGRWPHPAELEGRRDVVFIPGSDRTVAADAVVFHLPTLKLPLAVEKPAGQIWVAWSMESEVTCPLMSEPAFMSLIDITMNHRRDAAVWSPYFKGSDAEALLKPYEPKTARAPVVHFQSNLYDRSGRNAYAAELMKWVKVDSYGSVLNNATVPDDDRSFDVRARTIARYKFCLAFENSVATDYVSDKFFMPLVVGTVPVYLGCAEVAEFAPAAGCYVDTRDFAHPRDLARHLNALDQDEAAYRSLHAWRSAGLKPSFAAWLDALREPPFVRLADAVVAARR
jgi:hypothetical protein